MIDDRKWTDRYRTVAKTIADAGLSPAIAFAFWVILGLMVLFATAEGKDSPMTAFFTAFGAVGQVGLAYAVYRLGQKQFEFTKAVADRQARIDTMPFRQAIFNDWRKVMPGLAVHPTEDKMNALIDVEFEIERFFSRDVQRLLDQMTDAFFMAFDAFEAAAEIEERYDVDAEKSGEWHQQRWIYADQIKIVRKLRYRVHRMMREETSINLPEISS